MAIITLTTDFGSTDPFFGVMKGVILTICPNARIEDITHDVFPQDIWQANFIIQTCYHYFPKGTIHVCVVDPGVGSKRRPILIETNEYFFIGPDNGIFTGVLEKEKIKSVIELTEKKYWLKNVSNTFHGRDIFSPVAAHLAKERWGESEKGGKGEIINKFGEIINVNDLTKLPIKKALETKKGYSGVVQYIDHFGNLITNIPSDIIPNKITGKVKAFNFDGLVSSFAESDGKKPTAIRGSSGYIEIFIYKGNAAKLTSVNVGAKVDVKYL